ncbi:MAG: hypothetical protein AB7S38_09275 [Vulcanimicrobiota bacterium]
MHSKFHGLICLFLLTCLAACGGGGQTAGGTPSAGPGPGSNLAELRLRVSYPNPRVLAQSTSSVTEIQVMILDPQTRTPIHPTSVFSPDGNSTTQTLVVTGVLPGTWLVRIEVHNSLGEVTLFQEQLVPVNPGQVTQVAFSLGSGGGIGGDVAGLVTQGLALLQLGGYANLVSARDLFQQAVANIGSTTSQVDSDQANFFYALTRVAAVAAELPSDGNATDLNRMGDFLDLLGFAAAGRTDYKSLTAPASFNLGLSASEARIFLGGRLRSEVEGAIANLNAISTGFAINWSFLTDGPLKNVESDYGDVLALRAGYRSILAGLLVATSYDLGSSDVGVALNDPLRTLATLFGNNPNAGNHLDRSLLGGVPAQLSGSLDDALAALDFMAAETDPQSDDFINILNVPPADITAFRNDITAYRNALTSQVMTMASNGDQGTLDLPNYFANGLDLRPFFPPLAGDHANGFFMGMPFSPVFVPAVPGSLADPNHDTNMNGIPDILQ